MPGTDAAQYAREAALNPYGGVGADLTNSMCWDAVAKCMVDGGGLPDPRPINQSSCAHVISTGDSQVKSAEGMSLVPTGAFVGFFKANGELIHAMISLGAGEVAGSKSGCAIPMPPATGAWEIIDLSSKANWNVINGRKLTVHYRPM